MMAIQQIKYMKKEKQENFKMIIEKDKILGKWIMFKKVGSIYFEVKRGLRNELINYCKNKKWSYKIVKHD